MVLRRLFPSPSPLAFDTDVPLGRYALPAGERVYAIGDVHGRCDLLDDLLRQIEGDNAARRPADRRTLIFLGDLIDRGTQSRAVIDRTLALAACENCIFLMGNHEESLIQAWDGMEDVIPTFLRYGGDALLHSYGWALDGTEMAARPAAEVVAALRDRVPQTHIDFMRNFRSHWQLGDLLFVHAGIRPGFPIDVQDPIDMRWIRTEFTSSTEDFGAMIVHGHSITAVPDIRPNRIGIDTGAYRSGHLTALGLEGQSGWILST